MSFYNRDRNKNNMQQLTNALTKRDTSSINIGSIGDSKPSFSGSNKNPDEMSTSEGVSSFAKGGMKLYNTLKDSGYFNSGNGGNYTGLFSNAANNYISTGNSVGSSPVMEALNGGGGSGSAVSDAIGTEVGSGAGGGSALGNAPWGAIANVGKGLYNYISGKTPKDYSDTEQAVIYPVQGAANGFSFGGPWGALGGALYGLGYAFKDDLGLKDSNFLTQLTMPIGMGDGGGLRINGEPILDIL